MMSKQTAISAAASVFAMACFALLSPQSEPLETLAQAPSAPLQVQADIPAIEQPLPILGF